MSADWVALWWRLAFDVFSGIKPSAPFNRLMQLRLAELGGYIVTLLGQLIIIYILPTIVTYL